MDRIGAKSQDAIAREFHNGISEPDDPSEFLLKILGRTKDDPYTAYPEIPEGETLDTLRAKVPERRALVQSTFVRIREISQALSRVYRDICAKYEMNPGKISLYVVGGRVRAKPLQHSSDVDVLFTVQNQEGGLQPDYASDTRELIEKKTLARKELIVALEPVLERFGLLEKDERGVVMGWFVEPKGYGFSDEKTREEWRTLLKMEGDTDRMAVLVYRE